MTSYRTVCNAGWRTTICIEVDGAFYPAYEAHEFPGVVRFEQDHQPVPMDLCRAMGWRNLEAQQGAITRQRSAYETLMSL